MKTNKLFILLLLVFCQCANDKMIVGENEFNLTIFPGACFPEVSDKYVYPVVPGMEEWQQLETIDDAYKLVQLPDEVLKSISTPGLIDALIHAPLFTWFNILSSNASVLRWHGHYERFNSARELFQRKDAGNALVAYYCLTSFDCIEPSVFDCIEPSVGLCREYERMMGLEILFTIPELLYQIGHAKKKEAVAALLAKREQHLDYSNGIFPMVYLMLADKYDPILQYSLDYAEEFQSILDGYFYSFPEQAELMVSFAKSYINDKK